MPIIKSAKKRAATAKKAAVRNSKTKRSLRASLKLFAASPNPKNLSSVSSNIDKATKKGVIHKNKAARLKRRAALAAKSSGVKLSKAPAKKTAAKPLKKTVSKTTKKK